MQVAEENKNQPATTKQTWALFRLTGKDYRKDNLTRQQASEMISKLYSEKGITNVDTKKDKFKFFETVYNEAHKAGLEAGNKSKPTPMVVQQHSDMLDDNSPVKKEWFVEGGVCGFAWIEIRPSNSTFGKWLKDTKRGGHSDYDHCIIVSCHEFGQSMQRKEAYCHAFVKALGKYAKELQGNNKNPLRVYSRSRMD